MPGTGGGGIGNPGGLGGFTPFSFLPPRPIRVHLIFRGSGCTLEGSHYKNHTTYGLESNQTSRPHPLRTRKVAPAVWMSTMSPVEASTTLSSNLAIASSTIISTL